MSVLDHPTVSRRYFFPRAGVPEDPWWVAVPGARLCGWRSPAAPGERILLHFHGNGEVVTDYLPWWPALVRDLGLASALSEYRGYGGSTGEPALRGMLEDALAVTDALGVPLERVVVFGRSVGSIYALHVAASRPVGGLILESGIADPLQRLLLRLRPEELGVGLDELISETRAHLDHESKARAVSCPSLILHAHHDELVDVEHARQLASWLGDSATLRILPEGGHNSIFLDNKAAYLDAMASYLSP